MMIAPLDLAHQGRKRTQLEFRSWVEELLDEKGRGTTGVLSAGMELSIELCNTLREGISTLSY